MTAPVADYPELKRRLAATGGAFGLLSMQATGTAERLAADFPARFECVFSAEHGFFGELAAGEKAPDGIHPDLHLPIHSLYGEHRVPSDGMLAGLDRVVVDLCDIGVRCYTFLATLRNMLRACAAKGVAVTVLDRPVPFGGRRDGPRLERGFESFVAPVDVPLVHAMTPGEAARFIAESERLPVALDVVPVRDWRHEFAPWPGFVPPSPAIRSWDSAVAYPMTVFTEAYPAADCDRHGPLAFRVLGAPWLDRPRLQAACARELRESGVAMRPYRYVPAKGEAAGKALDGVLLEVADYAAYRPARAGVTLLSALLRQWPAEMSAGARPQWLDKLMGTDKVRRAATSGELAAEFARWER